MRAILGIDIETYSPVPLPKTGVYRYVDTDDFEILLFSYHRGSRQSRQARLQTD